MQILWNRILFNAFVPFRRLRQGDPLSPYLFILGMEKLDHLIEALIEERSWEPFMVSRQGLGLTNLFFADDLLLFSRATTQGVEILKKVLDSFCWISGHKVNK